MCLFCENIDGYDCDLDKIGVRFNLHYRAGRAVAVRRVFPHPTRRGLRVRGTTKINIASGGESDSSSSSPPSSHL